MTDNVVNFPRDMTNAEILDKFKEMVNLEDTKFVIVHWSDEDYGLYAPSDMKMGEAFFYLHKVANVLVSEDE
jgi:hypothetical protein